jgi:putative exporter of polyketide antibiotics
MTSTITSPRSGPATLPARSAPFGPGLAVAGLLLGAGGNTAQAALGQIIERPDGVAEQIVLANEHPGLVTAMCLAGTIAVPFMAIGFLSAARFLRGRARRTGTVAAVLLVLGMWGFMAVQTAELIQLTAMLDPDGVAAATYLDGMDSNPLLGTLFGVPFMAGCLLGVLVLGIGLLVTGAVPRWIPATWLAFIVLDFGFGAVGPVDPHWLYFLGALGLAVHIARDRGRAWANA